MKIRTEFVTNSSTTSFCIVGNKLENLHSTGDADIHGIADIHSLFFISDDYGAYYAGLPLNELKDNETLGEYKAKAKVILEKFFKECEEAGIKMPKIKKIELLEETVVS